MHSVATGSHCLRLRQSRVRSRRRRRPVIGASDYIRRNSLFFAGNHQFFIVVGVIAKTRWPTTSTSPRQLARRRRRVTNESCDERLPCCTGNRASCYSSRVCRVGQTRHDLFCCHGGVEIANFSRARVCVGIRTVSVNRAPVISSTPTTVFRRAKASRTQRLASTDACRGGCE